MIDADMAIKLYKEIDTTDKEYRQATAEYYMSQGAMIEARREWEDFMATGLYDGTIQGKNEAARHGMAIELRPEQYQKYCAAVDEAMKAESRYRVSRIKMDSIRRKITLLGVAGGYNLSEVDG